VHVSVHTMHMCAHASVKNTASIHYRAVYVSFGGLLMMLKGDPRNLQEIELDQRYLTSSHNVVHACLLY
jgi:hypothetical protein